MDTVQSLLLKLSPQRLQLADLLRRIILSSHNSIEEKIKWGRITFSVGERDIAFICAKQGNNHIELGFFKAASLHDHDGLFEGKGKDIRRIKISSLESIPAEQIKRFVKESIAL